MRTITILALLALSAVWSATARAATPEPSRSATATRTPAVTATSAVTASAVATPQATSTASPAAAPAAFTLSGRLVVDANGNGVADAADAPPLVAYLELVPWSTAAELMNPDAKRYPVVRLYSAPDGTFAFENLPPDSYSFEVIWFAGFISRGASTLAPTLLRAVFQVTDTGAIVPPDPLPKTWPGSLEPFIPDEPVRGAIPDPILLKKIDPNIVTIPVLDAGTAGPPPVGRVDVTAVLRRSQPAAVRLPSTGIGAASPGDGWLSYALLAAAAISLMGFAAALARRPRA